MFYLNRLVIKCSSNIGFILISVTADNNNRVNRTTFTKLLNGKPKISLQNPFGNNNMFVLFETVHILFCICTRNN